MAALTKLIAQTSIDLIQLRHLNKDPDYYWRGIGWHETQSPLGITRMVAYLQKTFPRLRCGYVNSPWRQ